MANIDFMLRTLCEADGIDVSSIHSQTPDRSSSLSSPHNTSDMPLELEEGHNDNGD